MNLSEALKRLDSLNESTFDISDSDAFEQMRDFEENSNSDGLDDTYVDVIDMNANTEDELKDSYVGDVILDCQICHSKIFKPAAEVEIEDGEELANTTEECPYCHSTEGYKILGQIANYNPAKKEEDVDIEDVEEVEDDEELEGENESLKESFRRLNEADETDLTETREKLDELAKTCFKEIPYERRFQPISIKGKINFEVKTVSNPNVNKLYTVFVKATPPSFEGLSDSNKRTAVKEWNTEYEKAITEVKEKFVEMASSNEIAIAFNEKESRQAKSADTAEKYTDCLVFTIGESSEEGSRVWVLYNRGTYVGKDGSESANPPAYEQCWTSEKECKNDLNNMKSKNPIRYSQYKVTSVKVSEPSRLKTSARKVKNDVKALKDAIVKESFDSVNLNSSDKNVNVTSDESGALDIHIENAGMGAGPVMDDMGADFQGMENLGEDSGDEYIVPIDAQTENTIEGNDEDIEEVPVKDDGAEDIVDVDVDDFDEQAFDTVNDSYMRKVYENVNSYHTTGVQSLGDKLIVEGLINFKSGKSKATKFVFESATITKRGKARFIGENLQISRGKKTFTMTGTLKNGTFLPEALRYRYRAMNESGESQKVSGTVKLTEAYKKKK